MCKTFLVPLPNLPKASAGYLKTRQQEAGQLPEFVITSQSVIQIKMGNMHMDLAYHIISGTSYMGLTYSYMQREGMKGYFCKLR